MGGARCLLCGCHEDEVEAMHSFPRNVERSNLWQDALGLVTRYSSLRSYRLCNRHFSTESYMSLAPRRLRNDAIPLRWIVPAASRKLDLSSQPSTSATDDASINVTDLAMPSTSAGMSVSQESTQQASTSGLQHGV